MDYIQSLLLPHCRSTHLGESAKDYSKDREEEADGIRKRLYMDDYLDSADKVE